MVKIKTDVIASFEYYNKPQQRFQVIQEIDETTSISNIEKYWVTGCAMKVKSPQDLVKLSLCVIEDPTDIGASVREDILEQGEDTLTFLSNYIEQTDIKLDKQKLKAFAKELYMEASE